MWSKLSAKEWFSQTRLRGKWLGNESTIKRCYFSALAELSFKLMIIRERREREWPCKGLLLQLAQWLAN